MFLTIPSGRQRSFSTTFTLWDRYRKLYKKTPSTTTTTSKLQTFQKKTTTPSNSDPYHPSVRCHPKCLMKHGHGPNPSKRGFQDLHPQNHFLQEMCPKRAKQKGQIRSLDSKSFFEKGFRRCLFRKGPFETSPRCGFGVERKNGRLQGPQDDFNSRAAVWEKKQGFSSLAVHLREYSVAICLLCLLCENLHWSE